MKWEPFATNDEDEEELKTERHTYIYQKFHHVTATACASYGGAASSVPPEEA